MEVVNFSTPTNTTGIANLSIPGENGEIGSGDTFNFKTKKKKLKSLKDYLKTKKS